MFGFDYNLDLDTCLKLRVVVCCDLVNCKTSCAVLVGTLETISRSRFKSELGVTESNSACHFLAQIYLGVGVGGGLRAHSSYITMAVHLNVTVDLNS